MHVQLCVSFVKACFCVYSGQQSTNLCALVWGRGCRKLLLAVYFCPNFSANSKFVKMNLHRSTRDRGTDTNAVAHSCTDHFPDIISISRGKDWN